LDFDPFCVIVLSPGRYTQFNVTIVNRNISKVNTYKVSATMFGNSLKNNCCHKVSQMQRKTCLLIPSHNRLSITHQTAEKTICFHNSVR